MSVIKEDFDAICEEASDKKEKIDADRNERLADRICAMLTAAVENGEECDEALNHYAGKMADEAEEAICEAELDERSGQYAAHLLALVTEKVAQDRVACVGVKGEKLVIVK